LNCPSCGRGLPAGPVDSCPFCGAVLAVPSEGALAPELRAVTPPARGRVEPMREIPGLNNKKKERTWKDEVRDRVRERKQRNGGEGELPLFRDEPEEGEASSEPAPETAAEEAAAAAREDVDENRVSLGDPDAPMADDLVDLPLRAQVGPELPGSLASRVAAPAASEPVRIGPTSLDLDDEAPAEWPAADASARPVERPAFAFERAQAAALDLLALGGLWGVVLYFTSRASATGLLGLLPSWPYLSAYLAGLGLLYAAFFTGSNGQTPGKMASGLRVVDSDGLPPSFMRALLRAAVGSAGTILLGLGLLPLFFDPARRALQDRLFHTRVVKG
jgi:uncharacterized RDD family membrane protein YckC